MAFFEKYNILIWPLHKPEDFFNNGFCLFLNAGNVTFKGFEFSNCMFINEIRDSLLRKGKLKRKDIVITSRGTVGNIAFYSNKIKYQNIRINSGMLIARSFSLDNAEFLYSLLKSEEFRRKIDNYISGSAVPQLPIKDLKHIDFTLPNNRLIEKFSLKVSIIYILNDVLMESNFKMKNFRDIFLSRLATME